MTKALVAALLLLAAPPRDDARVAWLAEHAVASRELQPLTDYLGLRFHNGRPLDLAGIDCQLTGSASKELLTHDLAAALPPELPKGEDFDPEQAWRTNPNDVAGDVEAFAMRDRQMGENLLWLAKTHPNRKIIVWATTFHNARNLGTISTSDAKTAKLWAGNTPAGEVAWKELGNEVYSIGFTSNEGEAGLFGKAKPLPPSSRNSLEDLFARAGFENAFLDFRHAPAWLTGQRKMHPSHKP